MEKSFADEFMERWLRKSDEDGKKERKPRYTQPVSTARYVYHITSKAYRDSINKEGLKAQSSKGKFLHFKNALFAHNSDVFTTDWYPITMDYIEWRYWQIEWKAIPYCNDNKAIKYAFDNYYDIWRIDTQQLSKQWFIDDVAQEDFKGDFYNSDDLFVVTFNSVPREFIDLCTIELQYIEKEVDNVRIHYTAPIPTPISVPTKLSA